jgi:hypothetical protein
MQLVAYGAQDIYLTGNPQITFFKVVYRRHTNFSVESIQQTWNGTSTGITAARCTATISRNGDLVHRMYLEIDGTCATNQANVNAASITSVEVQIGGQKIDKQTGQFMDVWAHLTQPNPSGHVGQGDDNESTGTNFQNMAGMGGSFTETAGAMKTFVPLNFWFCKNPGLALPLIALQYHEVKVIMEHTFSGGYGAVTANNLWCDYIYLDTDERRRFAQVSHEYLIEQLQYSQSTISTQNPSIKLRFNHPVKELIWTMRNETAGTGNNLGGRHQTPVADKGDSSSGPVSIDEMGGKWKLKLNGHDRFKERDTKYFTRTQVWEHHTGYGGVPVLAGCDVNSNTSEFTTSFFIGGDSIGVYSFALKPEEHQPSGTCNFSRIDNAELSGQGLQVFTKHGTGATASLKELSDTNAANTKLTIFAVNYNVLRIMSGMGGLAYSN